MRRFYFIPAIIVLMAFSLIIGCSDNMYTPTGSADFGGDYGATPGGSQDFSYFRSLVEDGMVPYPEDILIEGLFSEYDLPLEGPEPRHILGLKCATGYAGQNGLPGAGMFVQLGFSTNITEEEFDRAPQNISIVIDKSGSMGGHSADNRYNKMELVKQAVTFLVDRLAEEDIVSIVLFNQNMQVLCEPAPVNYAYLHERINGISASGSTNMDVGLRQGYDFIREYQEQGYSNRVFLFTDALPNTGNHSPGNFRDIVEQGSEENIGLTAFGVGIDFDQELLNFFGTQQGCNYFYLNSIDDTFTRFLDDFDFMVTPIAHNLIVDVESLTDMHLTRTYGFPSPEDERVRLEVSTLFLSRNKGAVLLHFVPEWGEFHTIEHGLDIADMSISYETVDGETIHEELRATYQGRTISNPEQSRFDQIGVRKTTTLARFGLTLERACTLFHEQRNEDGEEEQEQSAAQLLEVLIEFLDDSEGYFEDENYPEERELVQHLIRNMENYRW
ncbi:VWA domain-containing protein [bacterium]|nr:VWA domain-containing protein [bacterium]